MGLNGVTGRSSPAVDRARQPPDVFYNVNPDPSMGNGSTRPVSRNGSTTNITADLVRDLKMKEVELENTKKQMSWLREALGKAARSGYAYAERDTDMEIASDQNTELVLRFKQFKAQLQVFIPLDFCMLSTG